MSQQVIAPGEPLVDEPQRRKKVRGKAPKGRWFQEAGWRHIVGVVACLWALFPTSSIVSDAPIPLGDVVTTGMSPKTFSTENFEKLFNTPSIQYERWYANTMVVCVAVTFIQIFFSALAAFAFSRMRFTGRRGGLLALLLIQLFPQYLAAVALYLMFT